MPALSVAGASRATPCSVSTPPLIEPDGRVSRIRLSEKAHAFAYGTLPVRRKRRQAIPSLWRATPSATSEPLCGGLALRREVLGSSPISLGPSSLRAFAFNQGPFPPPALPGFVGTTGLSATPVTPACPSRASGWKSSRCSRWLGLPVLSEVSCRLHAAAYTPAGTRAARSLVPPPALAAFPGNGSGRLLRYQFRGLIGCSLALRPARSRAAPRATFASKAPTASLPPPPLRLLPAGATQLPGGSHNPLKTSSFSRRTQCSGALSRWPRRRRHLGRVLRRVTPRAINSDQRRVEVPEEVASARVLPGHVRNGSHRMNRGCQW